MRCCLTILSLALAAGGGCGVPEEELAAAQSALTRSEITHHFPYVGTLFVDHGERCTGTLVGERTVLTSHGCVADGLDLDFVLAGEAYAGQRTRSIPNADRQTTVRVDLGGDDLFEVALHDRDLALVFLDEAPPTSVPRASVARRSPPWRAPNRAPYLLMGTVGSGVATRTEHREMQDRTRRSIWWGTLETGPGRGGMVEREDIGGPTLGVAVGDLREVVGVHVAGVRPHGGIEMGATADVDVSELAEDLLDIARDDLCVGGLHRDQDIDCGGERFDGELTCGDGVIDGREACDDGNRRSRDGCNAFCEVEAFFTCDGEPSRCDRIPDPDCGDGIRQRNAWEECDDGNRRDGDGCSRSCLIERQTCEGIGCGDIPTDGPLCGDGIVDTIERCDDGNGDDGDGCATTCDIERGYVCEGEPSRCELSEDAPRQNDEARVSDEGMANDSGRDGNAYEDEGRKNAENGSTGRSVFADGGRVNTKGGCSISAARVGPFDEGPGGAAVLLSWPFLWVFVTRRRPAPRTRPRRGKAAWPRLRAIRGYVPPRRYR